MKWKFLEIPRKGIAHGLWSTQRYEIQEKTGNEE